MPVLFREIVFCECGRPAMHNSLACRTCYEDGLRRRWREDFRLAEALAAPVPMQPVPMQPVPMQMIQPQYRMLFAPVLTEEDAERIRASQSQTE